MIEIIKKIRNFIFQLCETAFSIGIIILLSKWKTDIKNNHKDNECIVMGNGPSLNQDIEKLLPIKNKFDFICVNDFALSEYFSIIKPRYYVLLDPYYWDDSLSGDYLLSRQNLFSRIVSNTSWEMNIFIPFEMGKSKLIINDKLFIHNKNIKFSYFNRVPLSGFNKFRFFSFRNNLGLPSGQNVLIAAILIGLNLGYKKVYLLGADYSFHEQIIVDNNNMVYLIWKHFYDENINENSTKLLPYSRNHAVYNPNKIYELFNIWADAFKNFLILNDYANYIGSKIYNLSNKSYIDAFERKKIESLYS